MTEPLRNDGTNNHQVASEQGGGGDGKNDVESNGGPDDDQSEQAGVDQSNVHGVGWDTVGTDLGEELVEWEPLVAGERPDLTGAGRDLVDGAEEVHQHHDQHEYDSSGSGSGDLVNHLRPRLTRSEPSEIIQVANVEHEGDDGDQSKAVVDDRCGEDGARQDVGGILQLLSQMDGTVCSKVCCCWSNHSDQCGQSKISPSITISELGEDDLRVVSGAEHPHDDNEGEESEDMDNDGETFENWELSNGEGVEGDGRKNVSHGQECGVP